MKIRIGFVSNSSSSSFVIIDSKSPFQIEKYDKGSILEINGDFCHAEFGWSRKEYGDWKQKLIFSYLQSNYAKNPEWLKMLNKVVKEHLCIDKIEWNVDKAIEDSDFYIDHQSSAEEGRNIEIFENETVLRDFVFRKDSYIQGGNDNE